METVRSVRSSATAYLVSLASHLLQLGTPQGDHHGVYCKRPFWVLLKRNIRKLMHNYWNGGDKISIVYSWRNYLRNLKESTENILEVLRQV